MARTGVLDIVTAARSPFSEVADLLQNAAVVLDEGATAAILWLGGSSFLLDEFSVQGVYGFDTFKYGFAWNLGPLT